eukprot:GILJ01000662.1.p1 GENE.GILJ01000662.1~~GILJ01000662.1.p1  ORF type:complete len:128 (-),score=12.14 GILJ01000662.1:137-520(-)
MGLEHFRQDRKPTLPQKEGYLTKQGGFVKNWKRRYFVLRDNVITYFKTPTSTSPQGIIPLDQCLAVKSADDVINKCCSFIVSIPGRTYYILAESDEERDEWIRAVGRSIVVYSGALNYHVSDYNDTM